MRLDKENGNTHWQDAMELELTQIHEYKVFKDTGKAQFHNGKVVIPDGFQKIRVHFVYAVKHDGRFKARLVADGHLTKNPVESIYSGVVTLPQDGCILIPTQQFGDLGSRCWKCIT